ncbi:MAG: TIGR00266 family protein [Gammaproteobacteria bacterium]|nr:TIGR00266 family protein [Gammaproteobacteria bacterium]
MKSHDIEYKIIGAEMQLVEVTLDPGETVVAEAGSMTYMEQDIAFDTRMGDGSNPRQGVMGKLLSAGKRVFTGESVFTTHFTNEGTQKRRVGFAAPYPGNIIALDLARIGRRVTCQKDAFLCAALGTKLDITFNRRLGSGLFGGEGFILQTLEGDGMAFIQAGGSVIEKTLSDETLRADTGCLVGFSGDFDYSIARAGGLKSMIFGGEGLFLTTLRGSGKVWLQSLPFSRMADRVLAAAPQGGGKEKGET